MSSIPTDWRKKIILEQIRVSTSLGRMEEARQLLIILHQLEPDNEQIKEELARLGRGTRLKIASDTSENPYQCQIAKDEQSAKAREAISATTPIHRVAQAAPIHDRTPNRINTDIIKFKEPTSRVPTQKPVLTDEEKTKILINKLYKQQQDNQDWARQQSRNKLRKHQRFFDGCIKDNPYSWSITEREVIVQMQGIIAKELKRLNREQRLTISICSVLVIGIIIALCGCMIYGSAKQADIKIKHALVHENRDSLIYEMKEAERPIYALLYPQLEVTMQQARVWLSQLDHCQELIIQLENGEKDIKNLSPEEYKGLKNLREAKDEKSMKLIQRLDKIKRDKLSQEEMVKMQLLEEISKKLPTSHPLTHDINKDKEGLQKEYDEINAALTHFNETKSVHGKNMSYMKASIARQKEIKIMLNHIEMMEQAIGMIEACRFYPKHIELLRQLNNNDYPAAKQLATLAEHLPSLDYINKMMRYNASMESSETLQKAERCFLGDLPTFSGETPATSVQINAMEKIFETRSFTTTLYQVVSPQDAKVWVSESPPSSDNDGNMRLTISRFDPLAKIDAQRSISIPQKVGMVLNQYNSSALIKSCKLTREEFFIRANILNTLTQVLQYQYDQCPILAQAFIYQQIITVIESHPSPALMGLSFSELLRKDIKSFKAILKETGITLNSQNWLVINPANQRAAQRFTEWFKQNRHHNYSTDCKQTLRGILYTEVLYAGHINGKGEAILHKKLKDDTPIWYLDKQSKTMSLGTLKDIEQAIPYSPLLYSSKG